MKKLIVVLIFLTAPAFANQKLSLDQGKTEFLAIGKPGFLKIEGKGSAPKGTLEISEGKLHGQIKVDLNSLDTGMDLRNRHMKEKYLKVVDYPLATLTIKNFELPAAWTIEQPKMDEIKVPAVVNIHGQERAIEVLVSIDSKAKVFSQFEVKISDFKIEIPSFMGVTVADKVEVKVESQLVEQKALGKN